MLNPTSWTREQLRAHSTDMRQFIDFRESLLPNGMRIIEAYNASGLHFTILPDRGFDIWSAHYRGLPLTWLSQGSPHAPDFGLRWIEQFNGGLLTTCGLLHVGPPEADVQTGEHRDLHGRFSRLRAENIAARGEWTSDGDYVLYLSATVAETRLFQEQLRLTRLYAINLSAPVITVTDEITNLSDTPSPLMLLYHINVGFPLVAEGARLVSPDAHTYARDDAARPGLSRWAEYDAPSAGYAEQVFYHHVSTDASGWSEAVLLNEQLGFSVAWDTSTLPYLTQWKNTRQGIYVSGIEPGNCLPEGQNAARASGRLHQLEAGETRVFQCRMSVLDGADAVQAARERIAALAQNGTPASGVQLDDYREYNG